MSERGESLPFEIQIGEYGAITSVGVRPPVPADHLRQALETVDDREKPERSTVIEPEEKGSKPYTLLEFPQPHFGTFRNIYALKVVKVLKNTLSQNGSIVYVDEDIKSLHGDQTLFE